MDKKCKSPNPVEEQEGKKPWAGPTPEEISRGLAKILSQIPKEGDRTGVFIGELLKNTENILGDKNKILNDYLDKLKNQTFENDEALITATSEVVSAFMKEHFSPKDIELRARQHFIEKSNFIPLNEILSYGYDQNVIHLHLAPARTEIPKRRLELVLNGFENLAKAMENDPALKDIKEITMTSWIVAKWPEVFEAFGCTIDGPISDEDRERHFKNDKGEIWKAHIDRADFLARYLKK